MRPAVGSTYYRKRMRLLALVLAAAAVMLLAGCSSAAQPAPSPSPSPSTAPFVGTWRLDWADATFAISNDHGQYRVLAVSPGLSGVTDLGACQRQGTSLVCESKSGEIAGDVHRFTLTSKPTTLKVVELKQGESEPARGVAVKVSASTASPTPSPMQ
jgi:hypothetical protein